jgi:hypothetical protein
MPLRESKRCDVCDFVSITVSIYELATFETIKELGQLFCGERAFALSLQFACP